MLVPRVVDFLLLLPLAYFIRIAVLKELGSDLDQPLRINGADLPHVFLRRQHQFVVDDPLRIFVKQRGAGVDVHLLVVGHCAVTLLGVLSAGVGEETCAD